MNGPMHRLAKKFGIAALKNWGWKFYLDSSANGKAYQASVHGTSTQRKMKCLPVFFSDQTSTIYEGGRLAVVKRVGVAKIFSP